MKEVLAVDIGSDAVKVVIGEEEEGRLLVKGYSEVPARGALRAGTVLDMKGAAEVITEAVRSAAQMANVRPELLAQVVGITGAQVHNKGCRGAVAVKGKQVTETDIARVKEQAKVSLRLPSNHEVIYLHPNFFTLDDGRAVRNPVGFSTKRLEMSGYVVTAERGYLENLQNCLRETPLSEPTLFFQPIAASFGVLNKEDFSEGAVLLDLGKAMTQVAVWADGMLVHADVLRGGGEYLVDRVAREFRLTRQTASWLIKTYGRLDEVQDEILSIRDPRHGTQHSVSRARLGEVLASTLEEHLGGVLSTLEGSGVLEAVSSGTVLVLVGGLAKLEGIEALAQDVFDMPAVVGRPKGVELYEPELDDPRFAVAVGLLRMALREEGKSLKGGIFKGLREVFKKIKEVF